VVGLAIRLQEIGDAELEEFVEQWLDRKAGKFVHVLRIGAANDKGRDVIGFLSDCRHEGPWELYQCKRKTRDKKLGLPEAMGELGKLFYHHVEGAYATLPTAYFFVTPRGIVGTLQDLLLNPSEIGPYLIGHWDQYCAKYITRTKVPLTPEIRAAIDGFDFSRVDYYAASRLAKDPDARPAFSALFELTPEEAPRGETPAEIQQEELIYIDQLRKVYGEACGRVFLTADEVLTDPDHGEHLRLQRTRFFEAAAFSRFHRDNTAPGAVDVFREDVYHSVFEVYLQAHASRLKRVEAVMQHAGAAPIGLLGRSTRVPVRQGMCHHLVNERRLKWMP
jgi:hypothetical protein